MSEKGKVSESGLTDEQKKQIELMESMGQDVAPSTQIEFGSSVKGKVVSMTDDTIFVDIAQRNEALLTKNEMLDTEGKCTVAEGDVLENLFVISISEDEIIVSKRMKKGKAGKPLLRDLMDKQVPVEGRVTGMNKGGFNVTILGHRSFCPFSSIDIKFPTEPAEYMGQNLDFVIARIENRGNNIVLSRLPLLEGDLSEKFAELEKSFEDEEAISGVVTRIANFGAFVDLGGIEGLIHISELTWDRDEKTENVVQEKQAVSVKIVKIEKKEPLRESRVSLSLKRLEVDPWDEAATKIHEGDKVEGTITRVVGFGAFVRLFAGVEGLIRTEEMGWSRVRKPSDIVKKGEKVSVTILNVDLESRKIDCSIKDMSQDPWASVETTFAVGTKVEGTIADEKEYGFFVDLNETITGLLLRRRVGKDVKLGDLKKGAKVEVTIDSLDTTERRIALSAGEVEAYEAQSGGDSSSASRSEANQYMKSQEKKSSGDSDFAALLKKALKK